MKRIISLLLVGLPTLVACQSSPSPRTDDVPSQKPASTCPAPATQSAMAFIEMWAAQRSETQNLSELASALRASWPAGSSLIVARAWRVDGAQWMALLSPDPERTSGEAILLAVERGEDGLWRQAMPAQVTKIDTLWPSL